mmetsp:Transcript_21880/g.49897  ORF Transcript_21880/g.49897 Transcript_21880/m.49897 type:complete len:230 (-) Transcript_21880:174-863(-)
MTATVAPVAKSGGRGASTGRAKPVGSSARTASRGRAAKTTSQKAHPPLPSKPLTRSSYPPKVPLGPIEDVLPLIVQDDDSIDTLMLRGAEPGEDGSAGAYTAKDCEYICQCLLKNTSITDLNFSFNEIGDDGAAAVANLLSRNEHPPISRLALNMCGVGNAGFRALMNALEGNQTVEVLEVTGNRIDDDGARSLVQLLKKNRRIKHVAYSLNPISGTVQEELGRELMIR